MPFVTPFTDEAWHGSVSVGTRPVTPEEEFEPAGPAYEGDPLDGASSQHITFVLFNVTCPPEGGGV